MTEHVRSRAEAARWRRLMVILGALLATLLFATATGIVVRLAHGASRWDALRATSLGRTLPWFGLAGLRPGLDSWTPMLRAANEHDATPDASLYLRPTRAVVKFQYPPPTLLPLLAIPAAQRTLGAGGAPTSDAVHRRLDTVVRVGGVLAVLTGVLVLVGACRTAYFVPHRAPLAAAIAAAFAVGIGMLFFPLVRAVELGQLQTLLDAGAGGVLAAMLFGASGLAGVLAALCALVKPQFALFLVWGAVRRDRRFVQGFLVMAASVLLPSVAVFGWRDHVDYLVFLGELSRTGEVFWANQSVAGLLHRALGHGDPFVFTPDRFAPPSALVQRVSTLWLLVVVAAVLWRPHGDGSPLARACDAAAVMLATAFASPIAWEHHYGVALPVLLLLAVDGAREAGGRRTALVGLMIATLLLGTTLIRPTPAGVAGPWGWFAMNQYFFGALLLFIVLMRRLHGHGSNDRTTHDVDRDESGPGRAARPVEHVSGDVGVHA